MRVLHVITGLNLGGAEVMLHRLLQASDRASFSHEVVSLTDLGVVSERIRELGIAPRALNMTRIPGAFKFVRLANIIRDYEPEIVQTWMYHADLIGGMAAKLARRPKIVWGIHNSTLDPQLTRRTTQWTVALSAQLSRWVPDCVVTVSRVSRDLHVNAGYDASKFVVIPNGFNVNDYRPDPTWRREVRAELGIAEGAVVVGLIARVDPQKDHLTFVLAAAMLASRRPEVRFLLCGKGTSPGDPLARVIAARGLLSRFLLLGERHDMPRIMNALDIGSLSSAYGEAFPLSIGEAMACAVPCVVTDVGDSAYLVGHTGSVVVPHDPATLASAWEGLVAGGWERRRALGAAARGRIEEHFALPRIAAEYGEVYRRVLSGEAGEATAPGRPGQPSPAPRLRSTAEAASCSNAPRRSGTTSVRRTTGRT